MIENMKKGGLILSRRVGESVHIHGEDVKPVAVSVIGVKGNQVRLMFHADDDVEIDREEVYDRKMQECEA